MLGFRGVCCLVLVITSGFRCIEGMFLIFYCIFGYIVHCNVFCDKCTDRAPNALERAAKALVTSGITHDATL